MPRRRTSRRPRRRTSRGLRANASMSADQFEQIRSKLAEINGLLSAAEDGDEEQRTEIANRVMREEVPGYAEMAVKRFIEAATKPEADLSNEMWTAMNSLGNSWWVFGQEYQHASDGPRYNAQKALFRAQTSLLNAYNEAQRQRGFA